MNLREWMGVAMGTDAWARMERTLPGALSKVVDEILYSMSSENQSKEYRGTVLKLSNGERFYHGIKADWPKWEGRLEGKIDASYCDVRKTLRQIQYLLEAYAFNEVNGGGKTCYCKACGKAAP